MGRLVQITPPASEPLTLAEAKDHLRVDFTDDDTLIGSYITAAVQHLDGPGGVLGRALVTQSWRLETAAPDARGRVWIDLPPVATADAVETVQDGTPTAWSSGWRLGFDSGAAFVEPVAGGRWPAYDDREDAIRITFTAGTDAAGVPAPIKAALRLQVAELYEYREPLVPTDVRRSPALSALLSPYRRQYA